MANETLFLTLCFNFSVSPILAFYFLLLYSLSPASLYNITSRMQASGERSPALHRRPRTCKPNH